MDTDLLREPAEESTTPIIMMVGQPGGIAKEGIMHCLASHISAIASTPGINKYRCGEGHPIDYEVWDFSDVSYALTFIESPDFLLRCRSIIYVEEFLANRESLDKIEALAKQHNPKVQINVFALDPRVLTSVINRLLRQRSIDMFMVSTHCVQESMSQVISKSVPLPRIVPDIKNNKLKEVLRYGCIFPLLFTVNTDMDLLGTVWNTVGFISVKQAGNKYLIEDILLSINIMTRSAAYHKTILNGHTDYWFVIYDEELEIEQIGGADLTFLTHQKYYYLGNTFIRLNLSAVKNRSTITLTWTNKEIEPLQINCKGTSKRKCLNESSGRKRRKMMIGSRLDMSEEIEVNDNDSGGTGHSSDNYSDTSFDSMLWETRSNGTNSNSASGHSSMHNSDSGYSSVEDLFDTQPQESEATKRMNYFSAELLAQQDQSRDENNTNSVGWIAIQSDSEVGVDLQQYQLSALQQEHVVAITGADFVLLNKNRFTSIPEELCIVQSLTVLNMSFNWISTVPSAISNLVNLKRLLLRHNELTDLPNEMTALTNLEHIELASNFFTKFPRALLGLPNIKTIDLQDNRIKELPYLATLTALETLNLNYNEITTYDKSIFVLPKLTKLDLLENDAHQPYLEQKAIFDSLIRDVNSKLTVNKEL